MLLRHSHKIQRTFVSDYPWRPAAGSWPVGMRANCMTRRNASFTTSGVGKAAATSGSKLNRRKPLLIDHYLFKLDLLSLYPKTQVLELVDELITIN